jgi:hypothetical protein
MNKLTTLHKKAKKPLPNRRAPIDGPASPAIKSLQALLAKSLLSPYRGFDLPLSLDGVVSKASC